MELNPNYLWKIPTLMYIFAKSGWLVPGQANIEINAGMLPAQRQSGKYPPKVWIELVNMPAQETVKPAQSRREQRRELRIGEVLDAATRRFNRQSFTVVTMEDVAADLDLMPATLYHYVTDKEDLVFRCFERVIQSYQQELEAVDEPGFDGLEKVRAFVRRRLSSTSGNRIAFSDLASLPEEKYCALIEGRRRNLHALENLIDQGINDGSITPSNARWTAIGVLSIVDWLAFWLSGRAGYSRTDALIAIDDILTHGVYRRDRPTFELPDRVNTLEPQPPGKREQKKQALLRTASILFNLNGVAATSMDEVAKKANVTRAALYYHAKDKAELYYLCMMREMKFVTSSGKHVSNETPMSWTIQIQRYLFEGHISEIGPLPTYNNLDCLKPDHRAVVMEYIHALDEDFRQRVQQAIDDGYYRKVSIFFADKVHAALTNRFALWYNEPKRVTPKEIADNHMLLYLNGLKRRN